MPPSIFTALALSLALAGPLVAQCPDSAPDTVARAELTCAETRDLVRAATVVVPAAGSAHKDPQMGGEHAFVHGGRP